MWVFPSYIVGTIIWAFTASMVHEYKTIRNLMFVSTFLTFLAFYIDLIIFSGLPMLAFNPQKIFIMQLTLGRHPDV